MTDISLAIDAMSGDFGPTEIVPAALHALEKHDDLHITLVGQEALLSEILAQHNASTNEHLHIKPAATVIEMHESVQHALRNKRDSSMHIAVDMLNDSAHACVSAGNTGVLMSVSKLKLKMLPGIDRPAICTALPSLKKNIYLLDLGANVDSSGEQLLQFAMMGSELFSSVENKSSPTVALLNIGSEATKGNDCIKLAATLLEDSYLNYVGFAEGTDIYTGEIDVIVCDGLLGNIALKTTEGVCNLLKQLAINTFKKSLYGKLAALICKPLLTNIQNQIDPRLYNGASLLGLKKIVVKSHGSADRVAFAQAIETATAEAIMNIPEKIHRRFEKLADNAGK